MKNNLKFIAALLCFYFAASAAFAQSNKKAFVGIWELSKGSNNGQPLQNAGPGYLKMFNSDGTFANVQIRNTGSVISHSGKYAIDNAQSYTETALYRLEKSDDPLGQGFKINYGFSENKKQLTLNFTFKDGTAFTEVWRKL